ncbi:MAG: hypothetical protein G01um101431_749 [Parcubacteria group bacterium Gr01-1014_31]|nr:MAG: hypothetical protein G01um101431_749 [Parcubacteria group bacterium Gr01-1014_31]
MTYPNHLPPIPRGADTVVAWTLTPSGDLRAHLGVETEKRPPARWISGPGPWRLSLHPKDGPEIVLGSERLVGFAAFHHATGVNDRGDISTGTDWVFTWFRPVTGALKGPEIMWLREKWHKLLPANLWACLSDPQEDDLLDIDLTQLLEEEGLDLE